MDFPHGNVIKFFDGPFPLDYAHCASRISPNSPSSIFGSNIQTGVISLLHSGQDKVLEQWEKQVRKGYVKKVQDHQINGSVIEIIGNNPNTVFITIPSALHQTLGIRLPNLVLVVKNLRKQFMFDVQILDDKNLRRRFRFSNRQSTSRIKPALSFIPMKMEDGWNVVQVNLQDTVQKTFGTNYRETVRVQIHGNCRLRRVLLCENMATEDVLPADLKAFVTSATRGANPP